MKFSNLTFIILVFAFILIMPGFTRAAIDRGIVLDDPELVNNFLNKPYNLTSPDLRLPDIDPEILNEESQNKLINLVSLFGSTNRLQVDKNPIAIERLSNSQINEYKLNVEGDEPQKLLATPLPGVSVDADFNKDKEENELKENTNISLQYWMNNRTVFRAEYGMENREWWDVKDIESGNSSEEETTLVPSQELTFNEEKNQTGSLGISFQTNDRVTISADYIDSTSLEKDFSTVFGVEYRDDVGTLKYHYQVDFGDQSAKESGLEFGYKDLATFNATYKIFDPKVIEDQLDKSIEVQLDKSWGIGLDVNLNDISTISLGYQLEKRLSDQLKDLGEESNIQAELKIKF